MATILTEGVTDQSRENYLRSLAEKAKTDPDAFAELSSIATGRSDLPLAEELFRKLDQSEVGEVDK